MRKVISAIILLVLSSVSVNAFSDDHKVEVCHKGIKVISIAAPSVPNHINHGDTLGVCEDETSPEPEHMAAVVMMRCEAIAGNGVVVLSASSSIVLDGAIILPILPGSDPDCAQALAGLINAGFTLKSIQSGSAENGEEGDDSLHLFTDYLLIGKVPADS